MVKSSKQGASPLGKLRGWWNRPEAPMESRPLAEHLSDLRRTLLVCILAIFTAFLVVFLFQSERLVSFVTQPLTRQSVQVIFTGVPEAFAAQTKLSLIVGVVLASPVVLGAVWLYIRPALRRRERVITAVLLTVAVALFALGVYFAYQYVFFLAVNFFVYSAENVADPMISLGTYVNFLFSFLLPFGIMFELPILVVGLTRLELVTTRDLQKARKFVIFGIFIAAAILTPPDVVSQVMLGVPMCVLYEIGVICSWVFRRREKKVHRANQATVGV